MEYYLVTGDRENLLHLYRIMKKFYSFLKSKKLDAQCIPMIESLEYPRREGFSAEAEELRHEYIASANRIVARGTDFAAEECSYVQ